MGRKIGIIAIIIVLVVSLLGFAGAYALSNANSGKYPGIVKKIAEKFDLDVEEVSKTFKDAKKDKRKAMLEKKLEKAVEKGTITKEQQKALLEKMEEVHAKMQELDAKRQAIHKELKEWAEENGIDMKLIMPGRSGGQRKGFGQGRRPMGLRGSQGSGPGGSQSFGGSHAIPNHGFDSEMI